MRYTFAGKECWQRALRRLFCPLGTLTVFTISPLFLATTGCASGHPPIAAESTRAEAAALRNDLLGQVQRMQKDDGEAPAVLTSRSLLDGAAKLFPETPDGQATVRIRAQVNGNPIMDEEIRQAAYIQLLQAAAMPEPERSKAQKEILERELQRLIEREIIYHDAMSRLEKLRPQVLEKLREAAGKETDRRLRIMKQQSGSKTDDELKARMKAQGMSLDNYRRGVEREFIANEYMRSRIFPNIERITLQQIRDYYQEHPSEFQIEDRVKWQDIFIDASRHPSREAARKAAEQIALAARGGEDFAKLVAEYDNGDSSYRNGEGYGQRRGEIKPAEAEPMLWKLKDSEIGEVIELASGFHIIRLVHRDHAGIKPFDEETQGDIRKKLQGAIADREWKRILKELKRKATIEIALSGD